MDNEDTQAVTGFQLSNNLYNKLKWGLTIVLPAVSTLYFTLAHIFGLPYATEVVAAIAALGTFGGAIFGISSKSYNNSDAKYDGVMRVDTSRDDKDIYSIEINSPLEDLAEKTQLQLKIDGSNKQDL